MHEFSCILTYLTVSMSSYSLRSTSSKLFSATSSKASLGHSVNQSIVVQLTNAGYCLKRFLINNNIDKEMKNRHFTCYIPIPYN